MRFHLYIFLSFCCIQLSWAQFALEVKAKLNPANHTILVDQTINWTNNQENRMRTLVLNDWNHAFSDVETQLARRFSDEYRFNFHFSKSSDKGSTTINFIKANDVPLAWVRPIDKEDIVEITLPKAILPGETIIIRLAYSIKLPNDKYTRYGFNKKGDYALKNWLLSPAYLSNGQFTYEPQLNLDDNMNSPYLLNFDFTYPWTHFLTTNLPIAEKKENFEQRQIIVNQTLVNDIQLYLEQQNTFTRHFDTENNVVENGKIDKKINPIQKAILTNQITKFADSLFGISKRKPIVLSQQDFQKHPFIGLNQLPNFLSPFKDDFMFEINFLKNYVENYLKTHLKINQREDYWLIDGIQMYVLMTYVDTYYPKEKMLGKISRFFLIRGYKVSKTTFNEQLSYFYLLMARRNLDQSLQTPRDELIKFNFQLANKYRAGLALMYLGEYIGHQALETSMAKFIAQAQQKNCYSKDFINILKSQTPKDINWFYEDVINSRKIIDYKISAYQKIEDTIEFKIENIGEATVPIPIYFIKDKKIIREIWLNPIKSDSIIKMPFFEFDKLAINHKNIVPEFNLKNNYVASKKGLFKSRGLKVNLIKDLEDPQYNQLMVNPQFNYNLYNGVLLGASFDNQTMLDRPFHFEIQPEYGTTSRDLNGAISLEYNHYRRNSQWFYRRFGLSASMRNYTFDAKFFRLSPSFTTTWRPKNFRENHRKSFLARVLILERENSSFEDLSDENRAYNVLNLRYIDSKTELTSRKHWRYDLQFSKEFGKLNVEYEFRHMFTDQRLLSFRVFAGAFLYNQTVDDFFSYGISRPTNYLFDFNLLANSETTGLLSQQFVMADAGFKSFFDEQFVNQWLTSVNASYAIWRWFEVYADAGLFKNRDQDAKFIYDSGLRVNLVPDYFEVYFPIYNSNGFQLDGNYSERIRFVASLNLNRLTSLFTRRWF